jgi:hypothetical protein
MSDRAPLIPSDNQGQYAAKKGIGEAQDVCVVHRFISGILIQGKKSQIVIQNAAKNAHPTFRGASNLYPAFGRIAG